MYSRGGLRSKQLFRLTEFDFHKSHVLLQRLIIQLQRVNLFLKLFNELVLVILRWFITTSITGDRIRPKRKSRHRGQCTSGPKIDADVLKRYGVLYMV